MLPQLVKHRVHLKVSLKNEGENWRNIYHYWRNYMSGYRRNSKLTISNFFVSVSAPGKRGRKSLESECNVSNLLNLEILDKNHNCEQKLPENEGISSCFQKSSFLGLGR